MYKNGHSKQLLAFKASVIAFISVEASMSPYILSALTDKCSSGTEPYFSSAVRLRLVLYEKIV